MYFFHIAYIRYIMSVSSKYVHVLHLSVLQSSPIFFGVDNSSTQFRCGLIQPPTLCVRVMVMSH